MKEAGLNFNVLCTFWLGLVDVSENDFPSSQGNTSQSLIPKFLNRLLGLSLTKQRLLTDCLLQFHGIKVANAKTGGKYDVGITTLAGQSVEFVDKPRSFCFGGVASIQVYQVQVDQGLSFEIALEMYNNEQGAKQVGKIQTGFV